MIVDSSDIILEVSSENIDSFADLKII